MGHSKAVLRRKLIAICAYVKKLGRYRVNGLNIHLKELGKYWQNDPNINRNKRNHQNEGGNKQNRD